MQTVAETTQTRKVNKAFYCTLYDANGMLVKVDSTIYFMAEDGTITEFEPEMAPWTCILGEVGTADARRLLDDTKGQAWIATHRQMEVA